MAYPGVPDLTDVPTAPPPGGWGGPLRAVLASRLVRVVLIVAALIALAVTGRLDPGELLAGPLHGGWLALALALYLPNYLVGALRYHVVLRALGARCNFRETWRITMISVLGELVLPPTGAADMVKAAAAAGTRETGRLRALASALVDRGIGLLGLVVFAALVCGLDQETIRSDERLARTPELIIIAATVLSAAITGLLTLQYLFPARCKQTLARWTWTDRAIRLAGLVARFFRSPRPWLMAVGLAAVGHGLWCLSAVTLAYGLGIPVPFLTALVVLPLVILANTVSLGGGIGGGTIAIGFLFESLFDVPPGTGLKLGLAIPLLTNASRLIALPWFLVRTERTSTAGAAPAPGECAPPTRQAA